MKKIAVLLLLFCGILVYAGYNYFLAPPGSTGKSKPIAAIIQEDVISVSVVHTFSGTNREYVIEGSELETLKTWVGNLQYEHISFEDISQTPNNGEFYKFEINEGDYSGFTYATIDQESYLIIDGEYYHISNPSSPTLIQ